MGVAGLGRGQAGHVGVEGVAASGAGVLGGGEPDVARPPSEWGAQIMEGADPDPLPKARLAALRTRSMRVIPTARDDLGGREHLGVGDAQGRVRRVDCRAEHGVALLSKRLFPLILRLGPSSVTLKSPTLVLKSPKNACR